MDTPQAAWKKAIHELNSAIESCLIAHNGLVDDVRTNPAKSTDGLKKQEENLDIYLNHLESLLYAHANRIISQRRVVHVLIATSK